MKKGVGTKKFKFGKSVIRTDLRLTFVDGDTSKREVQGMGVLVDGLIIGAAIGSFLVLHSRSGYPVWDPGPAWSAEDEPIRLWRVKEAIDAAQEAEPIDWRKGRAALQAAQGAARVRRWRAAADRKVHELWERYDIRLIAGDK